MFSQNRWLELYEKMFNSYFLYIHITGNPIRPKQMQNCYNNLLNL